MMGLHCHEGGKDSIVQSSERAKIKMHMYSYIEEWNYYWKADNACRNIEIYKYFKPGYIAIVKCTM